MPTFYRVAKRGNVEYGMYRGSECSASWEMCEEVRHPCPSADYKLCDTAWDYKFIFGFASKEQAENWIYKREWQDNLEGVGFVVYEITLHPDAQEGVHYHIGATQALWNKNCMDTKTVHEIKEFFK